MMISSSSVSASSASLASSGLSLHTQKVCFEIHLISVQNLPLDTLGKEIFVEWRRGSKRKNQGSTKHVLCKDAVAHFDDHFSVVSTIYQHPKTKRFKEKNVAFYLRFASSKGKTSTLGSKTVFNLADHVEPVQNKPISIVIDKKLDLVLQIKLTAKPSSATNGHSVGGSEHSLRRLSLHRSETDSSDDDKTDFEDDSSEFSEAESSVSERRSLRRSRRLSISNSMPLIPLNLSTTGKDKVQVFYEFVIQKAENVLSASSGQEVLISWKRGGKKKNHGHTAKVHCDSNHIATFSHPFTCVCTILRDPKNNSFDPKEISFYLEQVCGKKTIALGKATLLLSEHVDVEVPATKTLPLAPSAASLKFTVRSQSLKMNGKRLMKIDDTTDERLSRRAHIAGRDYYLQTDDEVSERDSDESEFDSVSFELDDEDSFSSIPDHPPPLPPVVSAVSAPPSLHHPFLLSPEGPIELQPPDIPPPAPPQSDTNTPPDSPRATDLKAKQDELDAKARELSRQKEELGWRQQILDKQHENTKKKKRELAQKQQTLAKELDSLQRQREELLELKEQLSEQRRALEDQEQAVSMQELELAAKKAELRKLEQDLTSQSEELKRRDQDLSAEWQRIHEEEEALEQSQQRNKLQAQQLSTQEAEINQQRQELTNQEMELHEKEDALRRLEQQLRLREQDIRKREHDCEIREKQVLLREREIEQKPALPPRQPKSMEDEERRDSLSRREKELDEKERSMQEKEHNYLNQLQARETKLRQQEQSQLKREQAILQKEQDIQRREVELRALSDQSTNGRGTSKSRRSEEPESERELAELRRRLSQSGNDVKRLHQDLADKDALIDTLQKQLARVQRTATASSLSSERIDRYELELREKKVLEEAVYLATLSYEEKLTSSAVSLYDLLRCYCEDNQQVPKRATELFRSVVRALEVSAQRSLHDSRLLAYWLSTLCGLLRLLKVDPEPDIIRIPSNEQDQLERLPPVQFLSTSLSLIKFDVFMMLVKDTYHRLAPIFDLVLNTPNGITTMLGIIHDLLQNLEVHYISDSIIDLAFRQVYNYVNCTLMNEVLHRAPYFSKMQGRRLGEAVERLKKHWPKFNRRSLEKIAIQSLRHVGEVARVLTTDTEVDIRRDFVALNPRQVKWLVDSLSIEEFPQLEEAKEQSDAQHVDHSQMLFYDPFAFVKP